MGWIKIQFFLKFTVISKQGFSGGVMSEKQRVDVLIVQMGLLESREKARAVIMSGQVYINNQKIDKAGTMVNINSNIEIRETLRYVSRGGLKLEKALKSFHTDLKDKVCLDIGASTGGFTDCMLQNGAKKVYAIDVGYGQLAWSLRNDVRVAAMERTNIRYVKFSDIGEYAEFASIDVSFISLSKVLPAVKELLRENAELVCLVKPQFEAGREKVGKKGVVRDPLIHEEVLLGVIQCAEKLGLYLHGLDFSPVKGPEGNIEYLALFLNQSRDVDVDINSLVRKVVRESHCVLDA